MTPEQINETLALFDRVNPDLAARQIDHTPRDTFKARLSEGPGIALGAVIDHCLPEGMAYSVSTCEPGPYAWVGRPGADTVAHMEATPALAMVRAISAAIGGEG